MSPVVIVCNSAFYTPRGDMRESAMAYNGGMDLNSTHLTPALVAVVLVLRLFDCSARSDMVSLEARVRALEVPQAPTPRPPGPRPPPTHRGAP